MDEILDFNFSDVLYSDVDISTLSRLSPSLTEDESIFEGFTTPMSTLKSPWSDSDSGVSDTGLLSDYCNEASPTESCPLKPELNYKYNQRVDQAWLMENNNSINSSNYRHRPAAKLSLGLNVENQYPKEKELDISNYINSVDSTEERKCNKSNNVSMLPSGTLPIKVINQTSTINSHILELTLKPELNYKYNQRVDQAWLMENNNSINSSNYRHRPAAKLSLGLNVENQYPKEKELDISNYINSVDSTEERKCNKSNNVSMLPSGTLPIKVINQTSTINSHILELTDHLSDESIAENLCCPEKENNLGLHKISPATKQEKPRTVSPSQNINDVDKSRKNALQAKLNREKKKAYTKGLEEELTKLKIQNQELKCENDTFKLKTAELETENDYLKSVLVNSSALSALLQNIGNTNGLKLSSTITNRKRKLESATASEPSTFEGRAKKPFTAGVCLHVSDSHASLEFCAHCSSMAQMSYES